MVVALTRRTFVAATPPKVTVPPAWKPLPASVTAVPPAARPALGEIVPSVSGIGMFVDFVSLHPPDAVTGTGSVTTPEPPEGEPIVRVPAPESIVPLLMVQT